MNIETEPTEANARTDDRAWEAAAAVQQLQQLWELDATPMKQVLAFPLGLSGLGVLATLIGAATTAAGIIPTLLGTVVIAAGIISGAAGGVWTLRARDEKLSARTRARALQPQAEALTVGTTTDSIDLLLAG